MCKTSIDNFGNNVQDVLRFDNGSAIDLDDFANMGVIVYVGARDLSTSGYSSRLAPVSESEDTRSLVDA